MCGNVKAPSIVGQVVRTTQESRIGSFVLGPVKAGAKVRILEEVELNDVQRAEFERGNESESAPDHFYNVELVESPMGHPFDPNGIAAMLVGQVVLFRDEFELIQ